MWECGKTCHHSSHLNKYQRLHYWEKPHQGDECVKAFTPRSLLIAHQVACTGEGPSECNECEAFMQSRTVFQRQTLHTSEKRHVQVSVGTLSVLLETLLTIREFTLGRSLTAVRNVVRPSVRVYVLFDTGSSMPGNKDIHVGSVENPSVRSLN